MTLIMKERGKRRRGGETEGQVEGVGEKERGGGEESGHSGRLKKREGEQKGERGWEGEREKEKSDNRLKVCFRIVVGFQIYDFYMHMMQ